MLFDIPDSKRDDIREWCDEQLRLIYEDQCRQVEEDPHSDLSQMLLLMPEGQPYLGAVGGVFTYTFTPTGIGTVIRVVCSYTKAELDVSDYDSW